MSALDWRELAPAPEIHDCDCNYCDSNGLLEEIKWPSLVTCTVEGVPFVTDRYLMVRADLAPVPDGYEGVVTPMQNDLDETFLGPAPLTRQAYGVHFRWSVMKAIDLMGWQLRYLDYPDDAKRPLKFAVFAQDNATQIGVAMSAREPVDSDWGNEQTREYGDTEGE